MIACVKKEKRKSECGRNALKVGGADRQRQHRGAANPGKILRALMPVLLSKAQTGDNVPVSFNFFLLEII